MSSAPYRKFSNLSIWVTVMSSVIIPRNKSEQSDKVSPGACFHPVFSTSLAGRPKRKVAQAEPTVTQGNFLAVEEKQRQCNCFKHFHRYRM